MQKKVPKPSQPTKSLNWSKLNQEKAKGTIWEHIDDEKMYKQVNKCVETLLELVFSWICLKSNTSLLLLLHIIMTMLIPFMELYRKDEKLK